MSALSPADLELLSAYLDEVLTPAERAAVERRLAADASLRAELEALRGVVQAVRVMPILKAPRDFRLDPVVYGQQTHPHLRVVPRRQPVRVYRWASALSAVAAMITLLVGLAGVLGPRMMEKAVPLASAPQVNDLAAETSEQIQATVPQIAMAPTPTPAPTMTMRTLPDGELAAAPAAAPLEAGRGLTESEAPVVGNAVEDDAGFESVFAEEGRAVPQDAGQTTGEGVAVPGAPPSADRAADSGPEAGELSAQADGAVAMTAAPMGMGGGAPSSDETQGTPEPESFAVEADAAPDQTSTLPAMRSAILPTGTLPVTLVAMDALPSAMPLPTMTLAAQEAPVTEPQDVTEAPATDLQVASKEADSFQLDPGILIGASVVLLVLAAMFFALSRR